MKTNRRICDNGSTHPTRNQSKPAQARAGERAIKDLAPSSGRPFNPEEDHPSCLCIYDRIARKPVSKIPLTEDEFAHLLGTLAPLSDGFATGTFIADAIRERLARLSEPAGTDEDVASFFVALEALKLHTARTLPGDIEQRRCILQMLQRITPKNHPAFQMVASQVAALNGVAASNEALVALYQ